LEQHVRYRPGYPIVAHHGSIMELVADLAAKSLLLFGLLLFTCQMLAQQLGFELGRRRRAVVGSVGASGVELVVNSLLALLAFTLALTLSYGSARYTERRAGILTEATAIDTAWLRAEAIGNPLGREIADLLKDYATLRRDYVLEPRNSPAIDGINDRSAQLRSQIWERLSAILQERPDDVTSSLMASLNDTFNAGTAERFALETKFPPQLFWLLTGMALISMATFGYQLGLKAVELRALPALLIAVWTAVLVVILDLSSPRIGPLRANAAVYDWTLKALITNRAKLPTSTSQ
jgi:hypothetical protein